MPMIFERQPRESAKAFAAFQEYLAMGPERSLAAVGAKLGKSKVMMEKWSGKFDWPARVAAHGAHLALVEREAAEAVARAKGVDWAERYLELRESEWRARKELVDLAWEVIRRWRSKGERCGSLEGLARLLDLMSTLGRRACEVATERKEVSGPDGGPIRVEIEAALDKIYGKPIPGEVIEVESAECGARNGGASSLQLSPPEEERGSGSEAEAKR
ncbi:MAG TPA: hypothetical protein P5205_09440 [Candidatus Paceibacterota bacterium]|nr:hypothetical protein [Verrucomicrobiota bacterium]HSA10580.1 hypothetical protein [Candidatus Paceibacterota bacterium]